MVERFEKGQADRMVQMKMGEQDCNGREVALAHQLIAQLNYSRAGVNNQNPLPGDQAKAGRFAAVSVERTTGDRHRATGAVNREYRSLFHIDFDRGILKNWPRLYSGLPTRAS